MNRNRWINLEWVAKVCRVSASKSLVLSPLLLYGVLSAAPFPRGRKNGAQEQGSIEKAGCLCEPLKGPSASVRSRKGHLSEHPAPHFEGGYEERPAVFFPENQPDFWLNIDLDKQLRWFHKSFEIGFRLHANGPDLDSAVQTVLKQQNQLLEKLDRMGFNRGKWRVSPVERGSLPSPSLAAAPAIPVGPAIATKPATELPARAPSTAAEKKLESQSEAPVSAKTLEAPPALVPPAPTSLFYAEACVQGQLTQIERLPEFFELAKEHGVKLDLRQNLKEMAGLDYEEIETFFSRERAWKNLTEQLLKFIQRMGLELKMVEEVRFDAPFKIQNPTPLKRLFDEFKGRWHGLNPELKDELNPELFERMCSIYKVPIHFRVKVGYSAHPKLKKEEEQKGCLASDFQEHASEEEAGLEMGEEVEI